MGFLPTSVKEVEALGWQWIDVVLFTGDAYIDHPSFGAAVIGRTLEAAGYRVAIVAQPNWQDDLRDFRKLGAPRLFFGVTAGAMDSTVNHYTPTRRLRSSDAYTPDGRIGARPDYPTIVYTQILKKLYPDSLVVLGGIEASLRRLTHYDYLQDRLRPSFLVETGADALIYGMGEKAVVDFARAVEDGTDWRKTPQTVYYAESYDTSDKLILHSSESCVKDPKKFAENFVQIEQQSNKLIAATLVEPTGAGAVVVNPPYETFTTEECDQTYSLPYMRNPAPRYRGKTITAWDMIKHSINIHRGCFGGCSFCAISMHQGKFIASRSTENIVEEARKIAASPDFKGTISDIGGPSANMWNLKGKDSSICKKCARVSCIYPKICVNLNIDHNPLLALYQRVERIDGIRHLFVGSGIRYDMFDDSRYFERVITNHTSGRLKVAPEHTETEVLQLMRKPDWAGYERMNRQFEAICQKHRLPYVIVPYFISAHPGCGDAEMKALKAKTEGTRTDQVQDFTPTPMTMSSVMYYTGLDPTTGRRLFVARDKASKDKQKSYFFDKHTQTQWQNKVTPHAKNKSGARPTPTRFKPSAPKSGSTRRKP